MSSSNDEVFNLDSQQVSVGLSAFIGVTGGVGVGTIIVQYLSGGSCLMMGASATGASLSALTYTGASWAVTGWILSSSVPITLGGPAAFYLGATGATSIVQILRLKSVGT